MTSDYFNEPIDKLNDRARKGLEIMRGLDRESPDFDRFLKRLFGVWGHFLDRLEWLDTLGVFTDKNLTEE